MKNVSDNDHSLALKRVEDNQAALDATNAAITYMKGLLDSNEADEAALIQKPSDEAVLAQIRALTDLAEGADQSAVAKIIGMLENIAANLQLSLSAESTNKDAATTHYNTVNSAMGKTLNDLNEAKNALDAELSK